jgi:RNA polymerase sigma factor (sigma-70 family)
MNTTPLRHQLLQSAQAGDEQAMAQLLRLTQPDIRRYALRHCASTTATDDLVQEALIIVYRRVSGLRNLAAFGGWLVRIVQRLCMQPVLSWLRGEPLQTIEDSARFAHQHEHDLRLDLARAIDSLPLIYRDTLLMRDFEALTINEMAERLGISREATKSRLHRARSLVREYLSDTPAQQPHQEGST